SSQESHTIGFVLIKVVGRERPRLRSSPIALLPRDGSHMYGPITPVRVRAWPPAGEQSAVRSVIFGLYEEFAERRVGLVCALRGQRYLRVAGKLYCARAAAPVGESDAPYLGVILWA